MLGDAEVENSTWMKCTFKYKETSGGTWRFSRDFHGGDLKC